MLEIVIPGDTTLGLQHLVLDYNGTLACDGELLAGVKPRLDASLSADMTYEGARFAVPLFIGI